MIKILITLSVLLIFVSCKNPQKRTAQLLDTEKEKSLISINPKSFINNLPDILDENSGIIIFENLIWTFNDSGGENKIFGVDFTGKIQKEIEIEDSKNVDWEDIAQDKEHIYIGDFGNNNGTRKDKRIYQIKKKKITKEKNQKIKSQKIKFVFSNQENFSFQQRSTPFDCEALIEFNNQLYLFTKNWENQKTVVYKLPPKNGDYNISPVDSFDVAALITGADISPNKKTIALIGYKSYKPILWLFSDFPDDKFFEGKKSYYELDAIVDAQTEGICFLGNDSLLVSCEQTSAFNQQVFVIGIYELNEYGIHPNQ